MGKMLYLLKIFVLKRKFEKFEIKSKTTLIRCFATIDKRKIARRENRSCAMLEGDIRGLCINDSCV